ncbi:MAG: class I SAM-dependent methyltransferase [Pseudomonadota bacterium]|nr:class I SAM-dependent methyltransferase [Pseudomonadota bacterium]
MSNSTNIEQEELWNGSFGEGFIRSEDYLHRLIDPFSKTAIDRVNAQPGDYILDVGCGCGSTSIALAQSGAKISGIDISEKMISRAIEKSKGISDISFHATDAASETFKVEYTHIFSQFGVMFFSDPYAAFSNIRSGLKEKGKITFLCWQGLSENEWISSTNKALESFQPEGMTPPDPKSPGGFAFADKQYVMDILKSANFTNIAIESLKAKFNMGESAEEIMSLHLNVGPLSVLLGSLSKESGIEAIEAVKKSLEGQMENNGLQLSAAAWLVTAEAKD